jgi:mannobiose 2-epimerase
LETARSCFWHYLDRLDRRERSPLGNRVIRLVWNWYGLAHAIRTRTRVRRLRPGSRGPPPPAHFGEPGFYRGHVLNELLPFWETHAPDPLHGGFIQHLDRHGVSTNPAGEKSSAMQARFVYAFARGYLLENHPRHLELARRGLTFLTEALWDHAECGWYQSVERDGRPKVTSKPLFSQAYALIGLLEFFRATGDCPTAATIARMWDLLDHRAWDGTYGGYVERCGLEWEIVSDLKTSCVHLDLLSAAITTFDLFGTPQDLNRVHRLAEVVVHRLRDPHSGLLLEVYSRDWRYNPAPVRDRVQVGHMLKGSRGLLEASRITGDQTLAAAAYAQADAALRHGWDPFHGGFFSLISRTGRLADSTKLWWHQCEGLAALACLGAESGVTPYRESFLRLAEFCLSYFFDPEDGEWFTTCSAEGRVLDSAKGGRYKAGYHTVAACLDAASSLERWPLGPGDRGGF